MEKVPAIEDLDKLPHSPKTGHVRQEAPFSDEKGPAKAYSLSVLFWGGGQFYNHQIAKGLSIFSLMAVFHSGILLIARYWHNIVLFLQDRGMSVSVFLLIAIGLILCALIFRSLCCSNAYYRVAKARTNRFNGTGSRLSPFLCSLLLPGWGQFLNGQPIKGSIFAGFAVISCFSLISAPVILLSWKDLEPSSARFFVESVFTMSVIFLPLIPGLIENS